MSWTQETGPPRWLGAGISLRSSVTGNYGGELSSGVWGADWCAEPGSGSGDGEVKTGSRPEDPEPFWPVTCWAFDSCDLTPASRAQTLQRAQQVLRMTEGPMLAREFAARLVADAGTPTPASDLIDAMGELEAMLAAENTLGAVHASPYVLPHLASHLAVTRTGGGWVTPGGHTVVFDAGYRAALGDALMVATSTPLLGWRTAVEVREVPDPEHNTNLVVAERSMIVTYEACLGAVTMRAGS